MIFQHSLSFAQSLDQTDTLKSYRDQFIIPLHEGKDVVYFTGNSLGLQPKKAKQYINEELEDWGKYGVEGHFQSRRNWFGYHHFLTEKAAKIVGAKTEEVAVMNTLSVNLNLLLVSFYQPIAKRTKIMMEAAAFPSDHYAIQQQVKFHGLNPTEHIILLHPREGEYCLRTEDILAQIELNKETLALVMLGGVNYYTGQFFDLKTITEKAHEIGAIAGYDLAHAAGNVELYLHDWGVDFACWCSYKYLNSGPGGVASIFVHERHGANADLPRFAGWWGNDEKERFQMKSEFIPAQGANGWQQSNAQIFSMAVHLASLELFDEVGMKKLNEKSNQMTAFLEFLLSSIPQIKIITPQNPAERGCQLSLIAIDKPKELFKHLQTHGIVADWREPDVIRVAPVPMYNRYKDCHILANTIQEFYNLN
jgi:kynureninase